MSGFLRYGGSLGLILCGLLMAPAQARAEAIIVVPMSIDYGDVDLGTPPRFEKVSITCELSTLTIFSMSIVSDDPNSPFAIATPMFFPITMEVGESMEVTIAFRPLSEGPHEAVLRIVSDAIVDPDLGSAGVVDVQLTGHGVQFVPPPGIKVVPAAHDYGEVEVDTSASATFAIANTGGSDLTLGSIDFVAGSDPDFAMPSVPIPSTILAPGETIEIEIHFSPQSAGPQAAVLSIPSDDPDTPSFDVLLAGVGIAAPPVIEVSPLAYDFGDVQLGMSASTLFSIANLGTADVTLESIDIAGDADFVLLDPPTLPKVIPRAAAMLIEVGFAPLELGAASATLGIVTSDQPNQAIKVPLSGFGSKPRPGIEVTPTEHDFGDVVLGESRSTIVTISSVGAADLTLLDVEFLATGDPDFFMTAAPVTPMVIPSGESLDLEVHFFPAESGLRAATLLIDSDANSTGGILVDLQGVGVKQAPPTVFMAEILDYFDLAAKTGTIAGRGANPRVQTIRLRAMRGLLQAASDLLEDGYPRWAAAILYRATLRMDGRPRPPDFIVGKKATLAELDAMILELVLLLRDR